MFDFVGQHARATAVLAMLPCILTITHSLNTQTEIRQSVVVVFVSLVEFASKAIQNVDTKQTRLTTDVPV